MEQIILCFPDEDNSLPWSGGVMVMKNDDVYFTTRTTDCTRQIRFKDDDESVPFVPEEIDALSGQEIRGKSSSFY